MRFESGAAAFFIFLPFFLEEAEGGGTPSDLWNRLCGSPLADESLRAIISRDMFYGTLGQGGHSASLRALMRGHECLQAALPFFEKKSNHERLPEQLSELVSALKRENRTMERNAPANLAAHVPAHVQHTSGEAADAVV